MRCFVLNIIIVVQMIWGVILLQHHENLTQTFYNLTTSLRSTDCHYKFSSKMKSSGVFTSPDFPNKYPDNTKCSYFFQASVNGRIKISFDFFDLESPSDKGCQFDYIEINDVHDTGTKTLMQKYCGSDIPVEFVSLQPKMEIVFVSDSTKNLNGFIGHYEFLGDNWHPFGPSTIGCGPGYLTGYGGVIVSPSFPNNFPKNSHCSWIIKVQETEKILIHVVDLDLSSSTDCGDTFLLFFNGFAIPGMYPEERYCGNLDMLDHSITEFLSTDSRVVIRFETGSNTFGGHQGFKLVWTMVKLVSNSDPCDGFLCTGSQKCTDINPDCTIYPLHFCIDKQLRCNGLPNCGPFDDTDEQQCLSKYVWISIYASVPAALLIIIVVLTTYCFRRHKRKKLHVAKTEMQRNQQTHWISPHIRSLENSPNTGRSSSVVHTTSFITNKNSDDSDIEENKKIKVKNKAADAVNKDTIQNLLGNDIKQNKLTPIDGDHHKGGTIHVHFDLPETQNYKSHQKRSSYHLMQELNLEEGNVIIADI